MNYLIVFVLSLLFIALDVAMACTRGNITHLKHGREPNAGVSLFPTIPVLPGLFLVVAWGLDWLYPNLGFWTVLVLFLLYLPFWWWHLRRLNAEFQSLQARMPTETGEN